MAGLCSLTIAASAATADDAVGIFRVTDRNVKPAEQVIQQQNAEMGAPALMPDGNAQPIAYAGNGAPTGPVLELSGNPVVDWYRVNRFDRRMAKECSDDGCDHGHARGHGWGHRHHSGDCDNCDGHHSPWFYHLCCACPESNGCRFLDWHCYRMVYAVDPWYFDRRDGQVYAAYGFGAPMSIPLAPNVTQQYNYGWGIPSSRITPISRMVPNPEAIQGAMPPRY